MSDPVGRPRRSREATRQLWSQRLSRFAASDVSAAAFCAAEGISVNSFFYWKRQLLAAAGASGCDAPPLLLPVRVAAPSSAAVEVVLPNGCALRLAPGCDLDFVRCLVDALGGEESC